MFACVCMMMVTLKMIVPGGCLPHAHVGRDLALRQRPPPGQGDGTVNKDTRYVNAQVQGGLQVMQRKREHMSGCMHVGIGMGHILS